MRLLEYEAKQILHQGGVAIPRGEIVRRGEVSTDLSFPLFLKSQVPTGGRYKSGGIKLVHGSTELSQVAAELMSREIKGFRPAAILAEQQLGVAAESYLAILLDYATGTTRLVAHRSGGVDVESNDSGYYNQSLGEANLPDRAEQLADYLGYRPDLLADLLQKLYTVFCQQDATLLEINPLVVTDDGQLVCGDCKLVLDDSAAFRHPEWDFADKPADANFVVLDPGGNVATIANGAGLAMATVDAVAASGMKPANFLDIGGGANESSVLAAFDKILQNSAPQAIIVNIFGGITRCDQVAQAIVSARQHAEALPPVFARLAGTNSDKAAQLLDSAGVAMFDSLQYCIDAARKVVNE